MTRWAPWLAARWDVRLLAIVLLLIVGGTWTAVRYATDYLLYASATRTAEKWADLLVASVDDLRPIGAGMLPSRASQTFFEWAQNSGQVFRYEIYDRQGFSQLVAAGHVAPVDVSDFSPEAVRSLAADGPVVDVFAGGAATGMPDFYARAFVPAFEGGEPVAIIAAYVDQTHERVLFTSTFAVVGVLLCTLTGLAFSIPAIAWYRRSKEKRLADKRIRFLAHHDALTGLVNRGRLLELLQPKLDEIASNGGHAALHFIDLDRFKEINDTQGHDAGDTVLRTTADRMRELGSEHDLIARLGGDEFVIVQTTIAAPADAEAFAERLRQAIGANIALADGQVVRSSASIGVALAPEDGTRSERLLKSADLALYVSKGQGKNCVTFFRPDMDAQLEERLELERLLRQAVADGGVVLNYQPILEMETRRLTGFEALARLERPDGTLASPAAFIKIAEELRLIDQLGEIILRKACHTAAAWPEHLKVSVNLSPLQFETGQISQVVETALSESGLPGKRLELEVTEQVLLGDSESVMRELQRIQALGVSIAMDDFGTGYSSLSYLWRFNFDKIKIDRGFMQAIGGSGHNAEQIVRTIIALGRELDMEVVVEGVETHDQVSFLDDANASLVQGYYFGRPMPETDVAAVILGDATTDWTKKTPLARKAG